MPISGHCLCKATTYTVDMEAPLLVGYDHCDDCQRQSGSTYSLVAVVLKDKLTINGPVKTYSGSKGSSGKVVHRLFCSECGSPIAHDPDAAPEIIALKAGTLETELKKNLKPVRISRGSLHLVKKLTLPTRIPRSGPSASSPSARSTWPSPSPTCPSKEWTPETDGPWAVFDDVDER
ncbi:hypothetical protein AUP68_01749 [Ilyonectria robusta]